MELTEETKQYTEADIFRYLLTKHIRADIVDINLQEKSLNIVVKIGDNIKYTSLKIEYINILSDIQVCSYILDKIANELNEPFLFASEKIRNEYY